MENGTCLSVKELRHIECCVLLARRLVRFRVDQLALDGDFIILYSSKYRTVCTVVFVLLIVQARPRQFITVL